MSIEDDIYQRIKNYRHVSFAELHNHIEGFTKLCGEGGCELSFETDSNIILWCNMSQSAVEAIIKLQSEGKIKMSPCDFLVYLVDGQMLRLPIAKRCLKGGYKKPHWAPVVFNPVEAP